MFVESTGLQLVALCSAVQIPSLSSGSSGGYFVRLVFWGYWNAQASSRTSVWWCTCIGFLVNLSIDGSLCCSERLRALSNFSCLFCLHG